MLRSALAVAAGYVTMLVLIMLIFLLIGIIFPEAFPTPESFPSIPWVVFILLFGGIAASVGAGVTITVCRGSRLKHIHSLAIVVFFIGLVTMAASIDKQPMWYLVTQIVVGIAGVYVGGHFANKRFPEVAAHS